jgi:ribosome-associated heat shock protein Hsp15
VNTVRIDKWLWAARFFKTRALAAESCAMGRVVAGAVVAKASRDVRLGDRLRVKNATGEFEIDVLGLSNVRGPAAKAQELYRETEESKAARAKME